MIEPGDDAGFVRGIDGAVCEDCLDDLGDEDFAPEPESWDGPR